MLERSSFSLSHLHAKQILPSFASNLITGQKHNNNSKEKKKKSFSIINHNFGLQGPENLFLQGGSLHFPPVPTQELCPPVGASVAAPHAGCAGQLEKWGEI